MNFQLSTLQGQNNTLVSPSGQLIAGISHGARLVLRTVPNLGVHLVFTASDTITKIAWSPLGTFILAVVASQGIVHIWSANDADWSCNITVGLSGLSDAIFHPVRAGRVFVYSDFGIKVDVWDIQAESSCYLRDVKNNCVPVLANTGEKGLMLSRRAGKDIVHVINVREEFCVLKTITLVGTQDVAGICWSNRGIVAWESPLSSYIYLYDFEGNMAEKIAVCDNGRQLGIRRVVGPVGGHIAAGCYDGTVQVFSVQNGLVLLGKFQTDVFHSATNVMSETLGGDATSRDQNVYIMGGTVPKEYPVEYRHTTSAVPPSVKPSPPTHLTGPAALATGPPAAGVGTLKFSPDGQFLAAVCDGSPSVLRIFNISHMSVFTLLVHRQPIYDFEWNPAETANRNQLAIVTGDINVFFWTPTNDNRTIRMKEETFKPTQISWTKDGNSTIVSDNDRVACVSLNLNVSNYGG